MIQVPIVAVAIVLLVTTSASPAQAARFCKDGYVTYAGSGPASSRAEAEASAKRAWREGRAQAGRSSNLALLHPRQIRCFRGDDRRYWRCYVRAGRCTAS
ncbi:MAG: hypothetical protein K2Y71_15075 [Xanthobacteraceae bacterium]|nr:hypothetical protein [Xanthobacteraceae bacterium]